MNIAGLKTIIWVYSNTPQINYPLDYNVGSGLVNENAAWSSTANIDARAANNWYNSPSGHKEIMMDRSKTCAAVGIARVDGVGSCVVLLVS